MARVCRDAFIHLQKLEGYCQNMVCIQKNPKVLKCQKSLLFKAKHCSIEQNSYSLDMGCGIKSVNFFDFSGYTMCFKPIPRELVIV